MPSDTYILTISDAGVSVPSSHASTHITGGSDAIPTATSSTSGLMSAAIFNQHVTNTAKVENKIHTGDVTDAAGVLTVNRINGVALAPLGTGILRLASGVPSIATEAQFPTLNQNTIGNAATATTATNIAGGAAGAVPYQTGSGATAMLAAGTAGYVLKSNGSAAPSWSQVNISSETTGTLPVASGGSGAATFTAGVLKANGTSAFTTVAAPSGGLVGTTDIQTLTNKTFGSGTTFSSTIGVASGGTGATTYTAGILKANGTSAFTTVTAPSSDIVGLTDTQTLLNKTFGSGTVFSTPIGVASGGTGLMSYTIGDIVYANTSSSLAKLPDVATGSALISGGVGVAPSYGKIGLNTHVTGTLPVASGGTGLSTIFGYVKGTGTSPLSTSETIPVADISGTLPVSKGGTGLTTTTARAILIGGSSSSGPLSQMTTGTSGQLLLSQGSADNPTWLSSGTTGQILTSAGSGSNPTWTTRSYAVLSQSTGSTAQALTTSFAQLTGSGATLDSAVSSGFSGTGYTLTYTGTTTALFKIDARLDLTGAAANDVVAVILAKGTTTIAGSESRNFTGGTLGGTNNSHLVSLSTSYIVSLATNETVTVYIASSTGSAFNVTVRRMEMIATQV